MNALSWRCLAVVAMLASADAEEAKPVSPSPAAQTPRPADPAPWTPPNRKLPLPTGIVDFPLQPTAMNLHPGPEYGDDVREVNMCPGIERSPGGRLWAVWISGGDEDTGYAVGVTSDNDGKTWSKPRFVVDPFDLPGARQRVLADNVWLDPKGRLWFFYDKGLDYYDGRAGFWAVVCENPDAAEPKWSEPRRIWHGALLNKPTVLSTGEWLLPSDLWERCIPNESRLINAHHDLDADRGVNIFASSDEGKTWERRANVSVKNAGLTWDFDEPMIVERKDGTLWMPLRTRTGVYEVTSADKGRTWSAPVPASFGSTNSRFFVRRLKSGRLLLVKNGVDAAKNEPLFHRDNMTAFLSDDDGRTWKGGLVLDERGTSYPDGTQGPDGRIYVTYDQNRYAVPGTDAEILMAVFGEDDVLAGKPVSPETRLKVAVNRAQPRRD